VMNASKNLCSDSWGRRTEKRPDFRLHNAFPQRSGGGGGVIVAPLGRGVHMLSLRWAENYKMLRSKGPTKGSTGIKEGTADFQLGETTLKSWETSNWGGSIAVSSERLTQHSDV